jgi:hypothetical protein
VVYHNGNKLEFNTDYYLSSTGTGIAKLLFTRVYDPAADYLSFVVFGSVDGIAKSYGIKKTYASHDLLTLTLSNTTGIVAGMTVTGTGFTSQQTVISIIGGTSVTLSAIPDSTPSGDLTFAEVGTTLTLVNTTGIVAGMAVTGTGFTSQQIVTAIVNATTVTISDVPDSTPNGILTFTSVVGYSIPELQVFMCDGENTNFVLRDYIDTDNATNSIVEINGYRLLYSTDYTIEYVPADGGIAIPNHPTELDGGTATSSGGGEITGGLAPTSVLFKTLIVLSIKNRASTPRLSAGDLVSITTFNDTRQQYLLTEQPTNLRVIPVSFVDIEKVGVSIYTKVPLVFEIGENLQVSLDGILGSEQLNNKSYYVQSETPLKKVITEIFTGDGVQTVFTLSEQASNLLADTQRNGVTLNGLQSPTTTYSINELALTFNTAPTLDAEIAVTYSTTVVEYYVLSLYLEGTITKIVRSSTVSPYVSGGFIWKTSDTHEIIQPELKLTDVNRLHVTIATDTEVGGKLVSSDNLRLNSRINEDTGLMDNYLSIITAINENDEVLITSLVSAATPNQIVYVNEVDNNGEQVIYRANTGTKTWLVQPVQLLDDTMYVNNINNVVDIVEDVLTVLSSGTTLYVLLKYDIQTIKQITVYNVNSITELAGTDFTLTAENAKPQLILNSNVAEGDTITVTLRLGDIVNINGEKIRYKRVNYQDNSISGLTRGIGGTGVLPLHATYDTVYSISPTNTLFNFYYDRTWNSEIYNPMAGDPLQISDSIPAIFLQTGTK